MCVDELHRVVRLHWHALFLREVDLGVHSRGQHQPQHPVGVSQLAAAQQHVAPAQHDGLLLTDAELAGEVIHLIVWRFQPHHTPSQRLTDLLSRFANVLEPLAHHARREAQLCVRLAVERFRVDPRLPGRVARPQQEHVRREGLAGVHLDDISHSHVRPRPTAHLAIILGAQDVHLLLIGLPVRTVAPLVFSRDQHHVASHDEEERQPRIRHASRDCDFRDHLKQTDDKEVEVVEALEGVEQLDGDEREKGEDAVLGGDDHVGATVGVSAEHATRTWHAIQWLRRDFLFRFEPHGAARPHAEIVTVRTECAE
mmetsp:Transcript_43288/g.105139  ORF Transcript_43288/g.105139 Transcript_43288/m.105139 type:complete len:312 (-) Transcript_43288:73-1008(-)